ncbi:MAG: hypothetical protein ACREX6_05555, partial [Casimicrobiaceae bacterium]
CRAAVASNWYVGMGADPQRECGEVDALGHLAFLRLVPDDPALPGRILARGLPLAQTWWQHYLGMVAGVSFGDWSRAQSPLAWSLADLVERVPLVGYLGIIAALAAAFVAAATSWVRSATRGHHGDGWIRAVLFASAVAVYAPVSAIFGDGYVEVSRHALLLHPAMMAVLLLGAGRPLAPRIRQAARERARAWRVAGAAVILAALLAAVLVWGACHWPTGQGVVDLPATRRFEGGVYPMRGWAVDPWGVRAVRIAAYRDLAATAPERVWMASYGHAVQGPHGESLAIYYPTYRGADRGGFALDIDRSAWPANAPCLRTRVENLHGVETEIDRRCLTQ